MGEGVRAEQGGRMGTHEKNLNTLSRRLSRKSRRILITRITSVSPPIPPVVSPALLQRCTDTSAGEGAGEGGVRARVHRCAYVRACMRVLVWRMRACERARARSPLPHTNAPSSQSAPADCRFHTASSHPVRVRAVHERLQPRSTNNASATRRHMCLREQLLPRRFAHPHSRVEYVRRDRVCAHVGRCACVRASARARA